MKRLFDILLASIALLILCVPFLIIMIILRFTGEGNVWYRQDRVGYQGKQVRDNIHSADLIRAFMPVPYYTLGTDGFGRSDTREALRAHFEVDRYWITVTALKALADQGEIERGTVAEAIGKYGINPDKPEPRLV